MSTGWQLPEIPDTADAFSIVRVINTLTWTGQQYENVGAPGGASSVRKVLSTAHRLKTVAEFNILSGAAPYAVVTVVDGAGNDIEGPPFSIPTHQAFLWWAAQMPLTPIADDWLNDDVVATFPEDPRVELLLTPDTGRLVGSLLAAALISGAPATTEGCMTTLQVIDVLRRLTGYADHDSGRQLEPEEDPTSPLAFLLDHYTGQHLPGNPA